MSTGEAMDCAKLVLLRIGLLLACLAIGGAAVVALCASMWAAMWLAGSEPLGLVLWGVSAAIIVGTVGGAIECAKQRRERCRPFNPTSI